MLFYVLFCFLFFIRAYTRINFEGATVEVIKQNNVDMRRRNHGVSGGWRPLFNLEVGVPSNTPFLTVIYNRLIKLLYSVLSKHIRTSA